MFKFCPECGFKLDKESKFCPQCGVNLENFIQPDYSEDEIKNPVVCNNCGEENNPENIVCSGCGIKLKAEVKNSSRTTQQANKKKYSNTNKSSQRVEISNKKREQLVSKTLGKKNIYTIVGALFAGIVLILIFSGILDAKKIPKTTTGINQIQGSGVDLNNLPKINELEAQLKANPGDKELLLELAHLKNDSGMYEQAIANYKQYLKIEPGDADVRVDMGVCYYNLGDFNTAISEMENALKYKPDHQIALLNLGIVNLSAGNLAKSKEWLNKAVNQNPNNDIGKRAKELLESHTK